MLSVLLASLVLLLIARGDGQGIHGRVLLADEEDGTNVVAGTAQRQAVLPVAYLLRDPDGRLGIEDIVRAPHNIGRGWKPLVDPLLMKGFSTDAMWIRFTLRRNERAQPLRFLVAGPPFLDDVRLYRPAQGAEPGSAASWVELRAGDRVPVSERPTRLREMVFPVYLEPFDQDFYLRIRSNSTVVLHLALWEPHAYLADSLSMNVYIGVMLGITVAGALMALLGWAWLRQGFFAIVAAYLVAFGLMNLVLGGYDQLWLYPEAPWIAHYVSATAAHALVGLLILVSLSYLDAARHCPRISLVLRGLATWMGAGALISMAGHYDLIVRILYVLVLAILPLLCLLYLRMFRFARTRVVMMALMFMPTLCAGALHATRNLGILPPDWWTGWFWDAATLAQAPFALVVLLLRLVDERQKMLRAQHREHAQRIFLDMISHELRTPLAVMTTALANIEQGAIAQNPALAPRFRRADAAVSRLGMLVDKALAMERLADDSGGVELLAMRPSDLLARFERQFYVDPPHRLVFERAGADDPVPLDLSWIGVAVSNLIDNAVKYTPAGGDIALRLDHDGERLRIEVLDSGIGVPARERPGIFGRFVRGQSTSQLTGVSGSGLGLYLVEQIALRHGGSVAVGDAPGSGTRFSIDLPACELT